MVIEPDAEVVQGHPRRQARAQTLKLMRPLALEAEGVEQLVVDALYDLAETKALVERIEAALLDAQGATTAAAVPAWPS